MAVHKKRAQTKVSVTSFAIFIYFSDKENKRPALLKSGLNVLPPVGQPPRPTNQATDNQKPPGKGELERKFWWLCFGCF